MFTKIKVRAYAPHIVLKKMQVDLAAQVQCTCTALLL